MRRIGFLGLLIVVLCVFNAPSHAQDKPANGLLDMLHYIPDRPSYRLFMTYGDAAAWHTSWNIPRVNSLKDLDSLDGQSRAYWKFIMALQTTPPQVLGVNYLAVDDLRGAYGFDIFNVDRYMEAGQPPEQISLVDFSFNKTQISKALIQTGYKEEKITGGARYSILDDNQVDIQRKTVKTRAGMLGGLNRIALLDKRLVIGRATAVVTGALDAAADKTPSLGKDPAYMAAAAALTDPALRDMGELVGAVLVDHTQLADSVLYVPPGASQTVFDSLIKPYLQPDTKLPPYSLVAFGTRHSPGASHLILAVVFPAGADAKAAAHALQTRLQQYVSLVSKKPLDDRWSFESAAGITINNLPVALVSMRVDDPPPTPADAQQVNAGVFTWTRMIAARDTLFLVVQ